MNSTHLHDPFWLEEPLDKGSFTPPENGGILVVGSGLTGVSLAYWFAQQNFHDVTIVDSDPESAASYRNCGHILYGTVESMYAFSELKGLEAANKLTKFSVELCELVRETCQKLRENGHDTEYAQPGYLVMALEDAEMEEISKSVDLLNAIGVKNKLLQKKDAEIYGFKNIKGGRFESGGARAHPVKFRNALLRQVTKTAVRYHSEQKVLSISPSSDRVDVTFESWSGDSSAKRQVSRSFDAAVLATNAYSGLVSEHFASRQLIEPFRGQIISSKPLKKPFPFSGPHSFNHGYEYGLLSTDGRIILGGWRENTADGAKNTFSLSPDQKVEAGLEEFAARHYAVDEKIEWQHSWSGIMASTKTSLPYIGPTSHPLVFACTGYTGHGFSWAHGSAKLCVDIMLGEPSDAEDLLPYFRP